jgi:hypothetical protein
VTGLAGVLTAAAVARVAAGAAVARLAAGAAANVLAVGAAAVEIPTFPGGAGTAPGVTSENWKVEIVPGAAAEDPAAESVIVLPGAATVGVAVNSMLGPGCMVTVVCAVLVCPRLSVMTSWKVTVPEVFGTVTGCI